MYTETILVAEDNAINRELIRELLQVNGYGIVEASDGSEALALARSERPSLALIDIQMPKLDGLEVVRMLREDSELCTMPTIALTAFAMRGDKEKAIEQGFDGYVTKPIALHVLLTEIERCLGARKSKSVADGIA